MNLVKSICISFLILLVITVVNANAVGVTVGPDGKAKSSVLQIPFAFYNQNFGAAAGYVWGVGGWPQKQSTLLTTTIAGTTGSAMTFSRRQGPAGSIHPTMVCGSGGVRWIF